MSFVFNQSLSVNVAAGSQTITPRCRFYDDSAGTYTTRTITSANFDLFTDTAAVNDYVMWSITYGAAKFGGLKFTLSPTMASTSHTIVWEYRKEDGSWATLTVTDGTSGFTASGDVTWTPPDDWGSNGTAVNGLTGQLWVRARLSAATGITEGGRNTTIQQYYNYSISQTTSTEYDSGTATSATSTSLTDTAKAWTSGQLINRIVYIHTGTGAGQINAITWNTATVFYTHLEWATTPDATSQYSILENFEDVYQADVAGGWGVVTKIGERTYALKCNLELEAAAFGDICANVEFSYDFVWFERSAPTSRYIHAFGIRLPAIYGLDKAILGNTIRHMRHSDIDNRAVGFTAESSYGFSAGNNYICSWSFRFQTTGSSLRLWFNNRQNYTISDYFEGWRSVTFSKTSTPRTEARNLTVVYGQSGIEQPFANYDGVKTYYNTSVGIFLTTANTITCPGFEVGQMNPQGTVMKGPISYYQATGAHYIDDYKGPRTRPTNDVYGSTPNTFSTYWRSTLNCRVTDQKKRLLPNARIVAKDATGAQVFDATTGTEGSFLSGQAVTSYTGHTFSLSAQPTAPTRLRLSVTGYADGSNNDLYNARIELTGTDANDVTIKELIFLEAMGNGDYFSRFEFKTISASGVKTIGWTGTLTVDSLGLLPSQKITGEKWKCTSDTTLATTDYNPITFRISRPGFDDVVITKDIITTQDWDISLKRSQLDLT
ncbi:MAG: hypothetical protein KBD44_01865 [Candidatus Pacebacteria bacterium]|nr:hypothetical protein [Candidatus Paceibacterota bacterium]